MAAKTCKFEQVYGGEEIKDERYIPENVEEHDYEQPNFPRRIVKKHDIYNVGSTSGCVAEEFESAIRTSTLNAEADAFGAHVADFLRNLSPSCMYRMKIKFERMVVGLSRLEAGKQRNLTKIQYVSSGCFSGVATRLVIQPLDVVKIRFQLQEEPLYGVNRGKYSGRMLKTMRMIWKEEGFKALWRGHIPGQALSVTYGVIQYSTFEALSSEIVKLGLGKYKMTADFLCGSIAGSLATACSMPFDYPLDLVRHRLQINERIRPGAFGQTTAYGGM
uniref:Uncharacterized protein n=1 Tax=Meloidogyne javanica TaxID=6303 RepID=A0A915N9T2_MELJA